MAGQVIWPESSHCWIDERSYVTPVERLTGDRITSREIGHRNKVGEVSSSGFSEILFLSLFGLAEAMVGENPVRRPHCWEYI